MADTTEQWWRDVLAAVLEAEPTDRAMADALVPPGTAVGRFRYEEARPWVPFLTTALIRTASAGGLRPFLSGACDAAAVREAVRTVQDVGRPFDGPDADATLEAAGDKIDAAAARFEVTESVLPRALTRLHDYVAANPARVPAL